MHSEKQFMPPTKPAKEDNYVKVAESNMNEFIKKNIDMLNKCIKPHKNAKTASNLINLKHEAMPEDVESGDTNEHTVESKGNTTYQK